MRRSLICVGIAFLTINLNILSAQDLKQCGLILDGKLIDSVDCWNFKEAEVIFPVSEKWLDYDFVELRVAVLRKSDAGIILMGTALQTSQCYFQFSKQQYKDWFASASFGKWNILKNGVATISATQNYYFLAINKWWENYVGYYEENGWKGVGQYMPYIMIEVNGVTKTGEKNSYDAYNRPVTTPIYSYTPVYQSKKYFITLHTKVTTAPGACTPGTFGGTKCGPVCNISGKENTLKFEQVSFQDDLFFYIK